MNVKLRLLSTTARNKEMSDAFIPILRKHEKELLRRKYNQYLTYIFAKADAYKFTVLQN